MDPRSVESIHDGFKGLHIPALADGGVLVNPTRRTVRGASVDQIGNGCGSGHERQDCGRRHQGRVVRIDWTAETEITDRDGVLKPEITSSKELSNGTHE